MQKQDQLKTTLPAWLSFAGALLMLAGYWLLEMVHINLSNAPVYYNFFGTRIDWLVRLLLDLPYYVLWLVLLILARRLRNPYVPLIVLFAFYTVQVLVSTVENWIIYNGYIAQYSSYAEMYERARFRNTLYTLGRLALLLVPCLLNSIFWRKKWIYLVCAILTIGYDLYIWGANISTEMEYGWSMDNPYKIQSTVGTANRILSTLSWLLYAMMIRSGSEPSAMQEQVPAWPVPNEDRQSAAPAGWIPPVQTSAAGQIPPFQAPAAVPPNVPELQPGGPEDRTQCPACGMSVPAQGKFCPKCGSALRQG